MKNDIREVKKQLREDIKAYRRSLDTLVKAEYDNRILDAVLASYAYRKSATVLTYVSTSIEVDTMELISRALREGKRVACPRCISGTHLMEFYYIKDASDLKPGAFGVLEPDADRERLVTDFYSCVCVVPGLSFDSGGYRLGYGKGYYDRFLSAFRGFTIGLCYSECIHQELPHGRYDKAVGLLITEEGSKRCYGAQRKRQFAGGRAAGGGQAPRSAYSGNET